MGDDSQMTIFSPRMLTCQPARRLVRGLVGLLLMVTSPVAFAAEPVPEANIVLDGGVIARELSTEGETLRTLALVNKVTGQRLATPNAREFVLTLLDGTTLCTHDYRVVDHRSTQSADRTREEFDLSPRTSGHPELTVVYIAKRGAHVLRKRLKVRGSQRIDTVTVEALPIDVPASILGFGQPLFIDEHWFAGLEYPAGENLVAEGEMLCRHHPGKESFTSRDAVLGTRGFAESTIDDEFDRYLATIRRPVRASLQYNSWYDRRGWELNPKQLRATYELFQEKLLDPYSLRFDAFMVDDGWQDRDSLWQPNNGWPKGFPPFAQWLESRGSHLGLWLPLTGYQLNTDWGEQRGYEVANHRKRYYCVCGPKYQQALGEVLKSHLRSAKINALKHDFNFLDSGRADLGHPLTKRHEREAGTDALLDLMTLERAEHPDVFIALTSQIWPSPWWLSTVDSLWMGGSDHAVDWRVAQFGARAAEMTYRDGRLFRLLRVDRAAVPASALMTHGLILGRYDGTRPRETIEEWSDYVAMYFGRGTLLQELYLSPDLVPEEFWPMLGSTIRWAQANTSTLAHTRMIGGRPESGEPYGYIHWSKDKGIACLRNPSHRPSTMTLTTKQRPAELRSDDGDETVWHPLVIYPERRRMETLDAEGELTIELPADSVTLVEMYRELPEFLRELPLGRFAVQGEGDARRLVTFGRPVPVSVHPASWNEEGPKRIKKEFSLDGGGERISAELVVKRQPAHGVSTQIATMGPMVPVERRADPGGADWDLSRYRMSFARRGALNINLSLPPSPFWPEEATVDAVLKTSMTLPETWSKELSEKTKTPDWPTTIRDNVVVEERIIVDGQTMRRSRSWIESVAWFVVLGIVPIAAFVGLSWQTAMLLRPLGFLAFLSGSIFLLAAIYLLSPMGSALARCVY
ncbi:hypothetical protein Pan216_33410 [Planctomycetes bacterium Pan216]|uniref:Alpha-galactosidase n=1 Tax=Kolteria novifilia TaxID=2527975 RepID=A0A518B673_9BACT|nr:hypothetical protein Pan216_33410 [Planctomycetes bacterium Pan216]